jgi:hypothetical protein
MTLDDEIIAVETVVQVARDAAAEHLERAEKDLHLKRSELEHYKDFLGATDLNGRSLVARCREMVSVPAIATEPATTSIVQGLLAVARESMRSMYAAMAVVEKLAGPTHQGESAHATEGATLRSCSFCGKTEADSKLVAGPVANICARCTRLACGVLGIVISDIKTE